MINIIIQFIISMIATIAFAILFNAPKSDIILCGISGALGWIIYYILLNEANLGYVMANLVGTLALTLFSRIVAATKKTPATIYLITGIFPLVPGAAMYYSAFYLILNDYTMMQKYVLSTLGTLSAIVLGISIIMLIPQKWFNRLAK